MLILLNSYIMDNSALQAIRDIGKRINYNDSHFQNVYVSLQQSLDIGTYLKYEEHRPLQFNGAFHFAVSVQVASDLVSSKESPDTPFIPFLFYTHRNPNKLDTIREGEPKLLEGQDTTYNYTQLFKDIVEKNGLDEVTEINFDVDICASPLRINNFTFDEGELNGIYKEQSLIQDEANHLLATVEESGRTHFIQKLAELYQSIGIKRLFFRICAFDDDFISGSKQTYLIFIAENQLEIGSFFMDYVRKVRNLASLIRTRYTYDLLQKDRHEAIKSAIAAIMSRNMSHNLGSHYLYYTKNHLERLANELSSEQSPDIRGAARVLGYTQARMDYLATIISNDKYPYGAVNFKSQIFDELTVDDFSKRHFIGEAKKNSRTVNYLLSNLIRSEDFTRPSIMTDGDQNPDNLDLLKLQIKYSQDGKKYECFTGTNFMPPEEDEPEDYIGVPTLESEAGIKYILSNIELALPGGNMSCHAFFNVVENFIRNSAKYLREDFRKEDGHKEKMLTTSIALRYKDAEQKFIEIILYDDKENATFYKLLKRTYLLDKRIQEANANISSFFKGDPSLEYIRRIGTKIIQQLDDSSITNKEALLRETRSIVRSWQKDCLYKQIVKRLSSIRVLDDNNALDKENKGLKEMMFSAAWMRSYNFPSEKTYTDIIFDIQNERDSNKKMNLIKEYCFAPIMVIDNGDSLSILTEKDIEQVYYKPASFGLSFELPIFRKTTELSIYPDEATMIQECLKTYSDIILADTDAVSPLQLKEVFTRVYPISESTGKSLTQIFKEILRKRFIGFDDYWVSFGKVKESSGIHDDSHHIKFDHHMKDHVVDKGGLESQLVYAYSDSVSGGDFTKTMNELFDAALVNGGYRSESDEFFVLKIKESALTRVTIIDERLSDTMEKSNSHLELSLKNIRLLNYRDTQGINSFMELFKGNSFKDQRDNTDFLSIHLGLVEKIIQSTEFTNFVGDIPAREKATRFMSLLRENFGGEKVFISIHSGRGNFSAELEGPLAGYPFITMSSLESAFNNSKFLLTQLLYNTLYIGKGKINKHSKS